MDINGNGYIKYTEELNGQKFEQFLKHLNIPFINDENVNDDNDEMMMKKMTKTKKMNTKNLH